MRGLLKLVFLLLVLLTSAAHAQSDCAAPPAQPMTQVTLPMMVHSIAHPFGVSVTPDGCNVFVSVPDRPSHLLVMMRANGTLTLAHDIVAEGGLTGMRLNPDGKLLAVTNQQGVSLFNVAKLISGDPKPLIGYLTDSSDAGAVYTIFSTDGRLLFVADENTHGLTVHDLAALAATGQDKITGRIPTGDAPVGLALSPDGKLLYSTSEAGEGTPACAREGGGGPRHPKGRLMVIDVAKAAIDPKRAVVADAEAGCSPVRVVLSVDGEHAYVTARGDNAVLVFDAAKLLAGGREPSARIAVATTPVGIAVAGGRIFVANSGRFGNQDQTISVLDQADPAKPALSISAGKFPREMAVTPDGKTLLVTNFGSGTLEMIDLTRLAAIK
jgi:DNA-binding beta-propeller fold protein YncE